MKKYILVLTCLILLLSPASATLYRCIDTSVSLSSKRVISIEKDLKGYMWFLTQTGADRYDGKNLTHYQLMDNEKIVNPFPGSNTLLKGNSGTLWQLGTDGRLFYYSIQKDQFILEHKFPAQNLSGINNPVSIGYIDSYHNIWYFEGRKIHIYQTNKREEMVFEAPIGKIPSSVVEPEKGYYYMATVEGVIGAKWINNELIYESISVLENIRDPYYLYFDETLQTLLIGTLNDGIFLYNKNTNQIRNILEGTENIYINKIIKDQSNGELLLATNGAGVYKLNLHTNSLEQAINEEDDTANQLRRNVIRDLYYDNSGKLWVASYLKGVFVYTMAGLQHKWISYKANASQSIPNNHVTRLLEDSDGDIWFATFDGVSCYFTKRKEWKKVAISSQVSLPFDNHLILSLCEESPGKILAGGYMSKLYTIDKNSMTLKETDWFKKYELQCKPGHYIRSIMKSQDGTIWIGGFPFLIGYKSETRESYQFKFEYPIFNLTEKDSLSIWVGTRDGLFTLNKEEGIKRFNVKTLPDLGHINHILADRLSGVTYIATHNQGLLSYNNKTGKIINYTEANSALNSDRIYCVLSNLKGNLFLTTENGISLFNIKDQRFTNWQEDQDLGNTSFSQGAGIHTQGGELFFGSISGVLVLNDSTSFVNKVQHKLIFKDFYISYERVAPGDKDSPLVHHIDDTDLVTLEHHQNIFSFEIGSVNFDTPSSILYSWKLDNFYEKWSIPSSVTRIRYMNLKSGTYKLHIRAVEKDSGCVLEERHLDIHIKNSFWNSWKGYVIVLLLCFSIIGIVVRYLSLWRKEKKAKDRIRFFINTLHDVHTPLTLIKTPLQEMLDKETLTDWGKDQLQLAIRSANSLAEMTKTFINFEKEDAFQSDILVTSYELNNYVKKTITPLQILAEQKEITLAYTSTEEKIDVWIDKNKFDYILRNIFIHILKNTPRGGRIEMSTERDKLNWILTLKNTYAKPLSKRKIEVYQQIIRGTNMLKSHLLENGMGILLTTRLIKNHAGVIKMTKNGDSGLNLILTIPFRSSNYIYEAISTVKSRMNNNEIAPSESLEILASTIPSLSVTGQRLPVILLVENNEELKQVISESLEIEYQIVNAVSQDEAIIQIERKQPDLVISDVKIPELDGYALCKRIKDNIETSHIPVILLTPESDNESLMAGVKNKADKCIVKPFDMQLLKAVISNAIEIMEGQRRILAQIKTTPLDGVTKENDWDSDQLFLFKVTELIKENLNNELNIDQLCNTLHISRTSFYIKMKALTNQTPSEFIRQIKMKTAEDLLKTKKYTVSEIADMLGFNDPKYFTEIFKKHVGVTPSSFMKQN